MQSVRSLLLGLGEGSVGTAGVAAAVFHLKKEDDLDQARQDPQGNPRSQACRRALLQQSLRGRQVVVSVPLWAQRQAIQQRCEVLFERVLLFRFQVSESVEGLTF